MSALGALPLALLAGAGFALVYGLLASALSPVVLASVRGWAPERRHRALTLLSVTPLVLALASVVAVFLPSALALVWPAHDHCLAHHGHVHLCLRHPPPVVGEAAPWVLLSLALASMLARVTPSLAALRRAVDASALCLSQSLPDARRGVRVLETSTPLCVTVGLLRPEVVVSVGLLASVSSTELDVMLHHERAHARRRDALRRIVTDGTTALLWGAAKTDLRAALRVSAEQCCDEAAGSAVGDRLQVAEVILKVERLLQGSPRVAVGLAVSFDGDVPARVESLLDAPRPSGTLALPWLVVGLAVSALAVANDPLHHLTESLLGALLH